jgi:YegS/Rv2252/BmrU family lipid kinase
MRNDWRMGRRVLLLVNPAASGGRAREVSTTVRAELQLMGVDHDVIESRNLEHAREVAAEAAGEGALVAACGGDGFIGTVAGAVRNTDGALAIIPGGRGNDLARVLEIPTDPRDAARLAVNGTEKMLDVATCNGKPFMCIASCGFDSDANEIANETTLVKGNLVYLYAALKALVEWKHARFVVTVDGTRHEMTGFSAGVGNSKAYGGGMYALPDAELDDGQLDGAFLSNGISKIGFVTQVLPRIFKGTYTELEAVTMLRGERFDLSADRPFTVYADGDPIAELPCTFDVEPRCLRVVVPSNP